MPVRVAQSLTASSATADFGCRNAARHRGFPSPRFRRVNFQGKNLV